jgi:hypothetical protein
MEGKTTMKYHRREKREQIKRLRAKMETEEIKRAIRYSSYVSDQDERQGVGYIIRMLDDRLGFCLNDEIWDRE